MERREWDQSFEVAQHLVGHEDRRIIVDTAMHDAVAGSHHIGVRKGIKPPCQHTPQGLGVERSACRIRPLILKDRRAVGVMHRDVPPFPEHLHLSDGEHEGGTPPSSSKSANLIEDDPALRLKT